MWTRRAFVGSAAMAAAGVAAGQTAGADRCSVMLWALVGVAKEFGGRVELAARAGFRWVEMVNEGQGWTEADWAREMGRMRGLGLGVDAIAPCKAGFAERSGALVGEVEAMVPRLRAMGRPQVIVVSGDRVEGEAEAQRAVAVKTLRGVAAVAEREGFTVVVEPIDRLERPGVWLDGVRDAVELVREVGSARVKVLYDFFHEQRQNGNLIETMERSRAEVALVHVADVPGRHQPGTGEVDYANVYRALRRVGYRGRVAMEFYPEGGEPVEVLRRARMEAEALLAGG